MGLVTLELKDGRQWGGLLPEEMMILDFRTQWRKQTNATNVTLHFFVQVN